MIGQMRAARRWRIIIVVWRTIARWPMVIEMVWRSAQNNDRAAAVIVSAAVIRLVIVIRRVAVFRRVACSGEAGPVYKQMVLARPA